MEHAEDQHFCEEFAAGKSVRELAELHNRTDGAIGHAWRSSASCLHSHGGSFEIARG